MEKIVYIIETQKGKFKPFVSSVLFLEEDNDSTLFVIASGDSFEDLKDAQKFVTENKGDMKVYLNPVKSSATGLTWLSELKDANKESDE